MSLEDCSTCTRFHNEKRRPEEGFLKAMFTRNVFRHWWVCNWCSRKILDVDIAKWKAK